MTNIVIKGKEIISLEQRSNISRRYKRITQSINREFWNSTSDTDHSFYVGSYGRGTAVDTSDIDILVELPRNEYERFDNYSSNGQSRLLQVVKDAVLTTYSNSYVKPDGQVVKVNFTDGIKFELLPAFQHKNFIGDWNGTYDYPDSNMGGNWHSTNPKAEQSAMKKKNDESNGLLYDTCKHMRQIRDEHFSSYHLSGIVIDSYVYNHIADWHWLRNGETTNHPIGTYEKRLHDNSLDNNMSLSAPGSGNSIEVSDSLLCLNKVLDYMTKE